MFRLERGSPPVWWRALLPVLAVLITFLLVSLAIWAAGANPLDVFYEMLIKPLTKRTARFEILVQATPLLLTGIAVTYAFAAGYYNIGAEGQLYAGALMGALLGPKLGGLPPFFAITVMLLAGFLGGVLWALVPALLKVRLNVDEVVTTLLLNSVIIFFISALLNGVWRDPISGWPRSPSIAESAQFPGIIPRSRVHLGFLLAILAVISLWWILKKTRFGLELRAAGLGKEAARFMGVPVAKTMLTAALISGGIAGLAGVSEVAGVHYYLIDGISPGYGYTGIIVATFGGLQALGVTIAGLFLALVDTGALSASRSLGIPVYLGDIIQATLLIVTLAVLLLNRYRPVRSR
ncbi:MAG: ABC transporter permease [Trueperaceae bacterium]|nr:ABC transporter permease [Trueperaceae bacterium]